MQNEVGFPRTSIYGREPNYNYLTMEVLGPDLTDLLEACGGQYRVESVLLMALQMLTRLESLHDYGFIHRDVKPANFLIGRNKRACIIYLCDFGLAKRYRDKLTLAHIPRAENVNFAGTPRYMQNKIIYTCTYAHLSFHREIRNESGR